MTRESLERVNVAIERLRAGRMVIMVDDEGRENEGDLVLAAQFATPESINFMATHGRGLICLALEPAIVDSLKLPLMTENNEAGFGTPFTVSIEAKEGVSTGISASDRAHTIQTAVREGATRADLCVPGHIFPLRAAAGGVLVRAGQTEGSVDLARLAKLKAAGVICEIMNEDGTMARRPELEVIAKRFDLPIVSVADLIAYRLRFDVSLLEEREVSTLAGGVQWRRFHSKIDGAEHWAFVMGSVAEGEDLLVRMHAENPLEDVFTSLFSGTPSKLSKAWQQIRQEGRGVLVYLRAGATHAESGNDLRSYGVGAQILHAIGARSMRLLSDKSRHIVGLEGFDLEVREVLPLGGAREQELGL